MAIPRILYTFSSSFSSHRLHRRVTYGFVDPVDHIVEQTTAIRHLLHMAFSWQPAAIRTSLPSATETSDKLSLMSEGESAWPFWLFASLKRCDDLLLDAPATVASWILSISGLAV
jgi:hypothetical protein